MSSTMYRISGLAVAALLALAVDAAAVERSIAVIDMDRAFSEYYKTQLADAQLSEQRDEFMKEQQEMAARFEAMQEEFTVLREEAQDAALSDEVRARKREEAEDLLIRLRRQEENIQEFTEQRRKQLQDQQRRMRRRIVGEIQETIEMYAGERAYGLVLDSSGQTLNGISVVLYAENRYDITGEILDILNKGRD